MNTNNTTKTETLHPEQIKLSHDEVAQQACKLWEAAGQPVGRDGDYWLQAEAELLASRRHNGSPRAGASQASPNRKTTRTKTLPRSNALLIGPERR
jgi:hypothetical protein